MCIAREAPSFLSNKRPLIALNCREGQLMEQHRQVKRSRTDRTRPKLCHSISNTPPRIVYITPSLVLFLISRLKITHLLVSCRSSNKPRLVRDGEVLHRILESITIIITIVITVILPLLLACRDTIIIVRWFIFKVKLSTTEIHIQSISQSSVYHETRRRPHTGS